MDTFDFRTVGGVPLHPARHAALDDQETAEALADPSAPVVWDFGMKTIGVLQNEGKLPDGFSPAPLRAENLNRMREWDGRTSIALFEAAKRIRHHGQIGNFIPAQYQPRGTCFRKGTKILLTNGDEKPIEEIGEGDEVVSHTGTGRKVVETQRRKFTGEMLTFGFDPGLRSLTVTSDHNCLVTNGIEFKKKKARDIVLHDRFWSIGKEPVVKILQITEEVVEEEVFCCTVAKDHSLVANGFVCGQCVGRGASGALNVLQAALIVGGAAIEYNPVSHAWCYAGARMHTNDLGSGDGAAGYAAFAWCKDKGVAHQAETGDADYYQDDIAATWARRGIPPDLIPLGKDNILSDAAPCKSAQAAAAAIASGGVVTIASGQGFTMTRDSEGVCQPRGSWSHQMFLAAIIVTPSGQKVFGCAQSWGDNVPDGPLLPGCPDYVFGIPWDTADRMLRQGDSMMALNFQGWTDNISWSFI